MDVSNIIDPGASQSGSPIGRGLPAQWASYSRQGALQPSFRLGNGANMQHHRSMSYSQPQANLGVEGHARSSSYSQARLSQADENQMPYPPSYGRSNKRMRPEPHGWDDDDVSPAVGSVEQAIDSVVVAGLADQFFLNAAKRSLLFSFHRVCISLAWQLSYTNSNCLYRQLNKWTVETPCPALCYLHPTFRWLSSFRRFKHHWPASLAM